MRKKFDNNLASLEQQLMDMYQETRISLTNAMNAFLNQDLVKANQVIKMDDRIDAMEEEALDQTILLIAQQAPVASDLRRIIVFIKISSELERIGDFAVNIAKSTIRIGKDPYFKPIKDIPKMMDIALDMYKDAMEALVEGDVVKARNCALKDDQVDRMYRELIQELMNYIPEKQESSNQITQLAYICRFIERFADHVTNIAENVVYLVTGKRYDLNE